jgi:flavodoxin
MKTLIVYYSRTGTTEKVAQQLAERLGADIEPLIDPTPRAGIKGFWSGATDARKKASADIPELHHNPAYYDLVLVGTPVWGGAMTPATRTFLMRFGGDMSKVGLFATTSMSDLDKTLESMAELLPAPPVGTLGLKRKLVTKDKCADQLDAFATSLNAADK